MNKYFTQVALIAILITGCGPAALPPPPTAMATQTIAPSQTPRPTQTAIPTVTSYPSLQTEGPYLLFTYDNKNFTIMDADRGGRKQFQLPNEGYVGWNFNKFVSPDGKWLAYFIGSTNEPYDLTLNLFNLEDETTFLIAKLIAQNFPQNLVPVINTLKFEDCIDSTECKLSAFRFSFIDGIQSLEWSPDGQHLAFAAQIDGLSSDIYVFNVEDKSIRRLTNEPENIYRINWSPNGQRILYDTSIEGGGYTTSTIWRLADFTIAAPQNAKAISEEKSWRSLGWFNEDLYFISNAADSPTYINTGYINTVSKKTSIIWPYITESMVLDSENNRIILSLIPYDDKTPEITQGVYLLYLNGTSTKILDEFVYLFPEQISFDSYLASKNNSLVSISVDGSITNFAQAVSYQNIPRVSPDKRWLITTNDNVTSLFSEKMQLVGSWDIEISEVIWRTDSTGAFLYNRDKLFYLSLTGGAPTSVDDCISKSCRQFLHVWLP